MKNLNIPKDCNNCKHCIKGTHEAPCNVCGSYSKFEPNPMFDEVYERGAQDMYDAVKKIIGLFEDGGYRSSELREIFDAVSLLNIMSAYDPIEIIDKIKAYEEKKTKELHVGDVVLFEDYPNPDIKGVVTYISDINDEITIMWANGRIGKLNKNEVTKLQGEHIDLGDIFEKLGGK